MKRILSIQDLSCVGKVALGAALPVISAMGSECCVLPTALLSAHTAFPHARVRTLTEELAPIMDSWAAEEIAFDAILTGYLGSAALAELASEAIDRFLAPGGVVIVDPVMGDHGRLYRGLDDSFVRAVRDLIRRADVILPNATETALLLGEEYSGDPDCERAMPLLKRLKALGPASAVITGVTGPMDALGAAAMDPEGAFLFSGDERLPGSYFGTGDLFAAALTGALARGASLQKALDMAVAFVEESIRQTLADEDRRHYATSFERALPLLTDWSRGIDEKKDGRKPS